MRDVTVVGTVCHPFLLRLLSARALVFSFSLQESPGEIPIPKGPLSLNNLTAKEKGRGESLGYIYSRQKVQVMNDWGGGGDGTVEAFSVVDYEPQKRKKISFQWKERKSGGGLGEVVRPQGKGAVSGREA